VHAHRKDTAIGDQWWLMVEVETSDQRVFISGAKFNLRRMRVAC